MQIRACGTYRCRSQLLTAFSNEGRVAPHVVGMLLTITTLVAGARSVLFLLKRISIPKVFRVLGPPLLIGLSLLLAATVRTTTGLLNVGYNGLPRGWATGARFGYVRTDFVNSPREDDAWLAGANVSYEVWRNFGVTLDYQYKTVDSNVVGQSFNQHLVSLGATYKY